MWTIQPFVRTNPRVLIKGAQKEYEKDTLDCGKNIVKNPVNL